MSLNIRTPDPNQAKVFDVADPDRHGQVIKAGPQQSEVRFDDGISRIVSNDHLRSIGTQVDRLDGPTDNAEPEVATVHHGQQAWARLRTHSTWQDWKAVGAAHVIGRATAMRDAHTNKPEGRGYNAAFAAWARKFGFADLDKGDRSRLFQVMDHLVEIEAWLEKLNLKNSAKRLSLNHPTSVLRNWKAATAEKSSEPKTLPVQKLKDELIAVIEERDRYKREIERGGGDVWTPEDTPKVIAKIMLGKLSKSKAENVAREILKALKGANK